MRGGRNRDSDETTGGAGGVGTSGAAIAATSLRKVYDGRTALDVERFEAERGEIAAVMGPSGSGKTTLLRLLATLERPTEGEVRFQGRVWSAPANSWTPNGGSTPADLLAWRRSVSFVPQNPLLFLGTVRENVALALELRSWDATARGTTGAHRVAEALDRVKLSALAGAAAGSLSAGEAQRVALARALVTAPAVLLLDEPTANLDPGNVGIIEETLAEATRAWHPAVVLVTHNLFQARRLADRTALLVGGRLVEEGETEQLFERPADPRTAAFVRGEMVC